MAGMKINYQSICFVVSLVLLSFVMVFWSDLFLFAKTVRLPAWVESLPSPINAPKYFVFLCLIPALLFANTLADASAQISKIILISAIFPVLIYIFKTNSQGVNLLYNLIFQYLWVIGWSCLLPAFILLGLRAIWQNLAIRLTPQSNRTSNGTPYANVTIYETNLDLLAAGVVIRVYL